MGLEMGVHILQEGKMNHRESSDLLKVTQALGSEHRSLDPLHKASISPHPLQWANLPYPITHMAENGGSPCCWRGGSRLELSLDDTNRIHLLGFLI